MQFDAIAEGEIQRSAAATADTLSEITPSTLPDWMKVALAEELGVPWDLSEF
jgi:hypothetical protein